MPTIPALGKKEDEDIHSYEDTELNFCLGSMRSCPKITKSRTHVPCAILLVNMDMF